MLKQQIKNYKSIFQQALSITKETEEFCTELRTEPEEKKHSVSLTYAVPIIILITISIFLGYFINTKGPKLEIGILKTIFNFLAITAGYYISVLICQKTTTTIFHQEITRSEAENIIAYSMTTIFGIRLILAYFPGFFFVNLLALHTLYLLWCMASNYLQLDEKYRTAFMLLNTASIIAIPYLATKIFQLLIPNVTI